MPKTTSAHLTEDGGNTNTVAKPHFDHSPNSLPVYALALRKWLPTVDARYVVLVETHTVLDRRTVCCRNTAHINALQAPTFAKGTFAKPYLPPGFGKSLAEAKDLASFEDALESTPPSSPKPSSKEPASSSAPATVKSEPAIAKTASDSRGVYPENCSLLDSEMFNSIISTWEDSDESESAEATYGRSGVRLLLSITEELANVATDSGALGYGAKVLSDMDAIEKSGVPAATVASCNAFKLSLVNKRKNSAS